MPDAQKPSKTAFVSIPPWLQWSAHAVGGLTFFIVLLPLLAVLWNMHARADHILKDSIRDQLMSAARVVAKSVDAKAHNHLWKSGQDQSEDYKRQLRGMEEAKQAVDPLGMIKFAYTCILDSGEVKFVLDATPDGDANRDGINDRARLMEVYERASPTLLTVLKTGLPKVDTEPYTDRWGTFMSGYAPILDPSSGEVAAACVDMSLQDYDLQRADLWHLSLLSGAGIVFLAYIAAAWMAWYHRRLQKSLAQLIQASDAAAAAERVKADFLGAMSHELRTPLNAVLGMSEMLAQTELDDSQRGMVAAVSKSGESLLATLTGILEFSQLDSRRIIHDLEETSLRALLQEVMRLHDADARQKGLRCDLVIAAGCPDRFTCHASFLKQVLSQLLDNAVKFTDTGSITVRADATRDGDGGTLLFEIQDTGIGIAPEHLERLFEPLYQVDGSTKRRHGGTGMGLALCQRLCEAMQGRLWVTSHPGQGSTFHLEMRSESFRDEAKPDQRSVLIWTDDSMTAMLASRVIEKTGASVIRAQSLNDLRNLPKADDIAHMVLDAHVVSRDMMKAIRQMRPRARLILLNGDEGMIGPDGADKLAASPLKPADLRLALLDEGS